MTPRNVIHFGGAALCAVGVLLLVATASIASALGAVTGDAVAGKDPSSKAFWVQLTFMRLFATTLIGLGAILLWCRSHLADAQLSSLLKVLSVVLVGLALMTVGQQIAIWNSSTGWIFSCALLLMAAACVVSTVVTQAHTVRASE